MIEMKNFMKEIWDKHFEFQIQDLSREVDSAITEGSHFSFQAEEGTLMRDALHRSIDNVL